MQRFNRFEYSKEEGKIIKVPFKVDDFRTQIACEANINLENLKSESIKRIQNGPRFLQLLIAALNQINWEPYKDFAQKYPLRISTSFGGGIGGLDWRQKQTEKLLDKGPSKLSPFFVSFDLIDTGVLPASFEVQAHGPNPGYVTACASGGTALIAAIKEILLGNVDIVIVNSAEGGICPPGIGGFNAGWALSKRNDDPRTASRPWDKDRDGFVMGEGAAIYIIAEYEIAKVLGLPILVEITGYGETADAYHLAASHPDGKWAAEAMKLALQKANLTPKDIDWVKAHGTSTKDGDIAEAKAINAVFSEKNPEVGVVSIKSIIGHSLGPSLNLESVSCIKSIRESIIPGTINVFDIDPECSMINIITKTINKEVTHVMANAFGFNGHNTVVIFSRI